MGVAPPAGVRIRDAVPADAAGLVAHSRRLAAEPERRSPVAVDEVGGVDSQREVIRQLADHPRSCYLVAERDGAVVGDLECRGFDLAALEHVVLLGMAVAPDHRRQGIGAALLAAAIDWARHAGITRIELNTFATNAPAQALYRRFGFVEEGRRRNFVRLDGEYVDDLVMGLLL